MYWLKYRYFKETLPDVYEKYRLVFLLFNGDEDEELMNLDKLCDFMKEEKYEIFIEEVLRSKPKSVQHLLHVTKD